MDAVGSSPIVREVRPTDRARWEELFRGYIAFYEAAVADDVIARTFKHLIDRERGDMVGFLAVDGGGRVAGLAHAVFHASTWATTGYCYLEDLYVAQEARSAGLGAALIEAVYREADKRGAGRTYWVTREDNLIARRLYDRLAAQAPFVQYRR